MANAREVVIVNGVRTAIGDYGGSLKDVPPTELGGERLGQSRTLGEPVGARQAARHGDVGSAALGQVVSDEFRGERAAGRGLNPAGLPAPGPHLLRVDVGLAPVPAGNLVPRPVHRTGGSGVGAVRVLFA